MTDYIYDVHQLARDNDMSIICRCPHCQNIIGIEGREFSDVRGEQYKCRCGDWLAVSSTACRVKPENLLPNKGIPDDE